jgi:hypothetical protein
MSPSESLIMPAIRFTVAYKLEYTGKRDSSVFAARLIG